MSDSFVVSEHGRQLSPRLLGLLEEVCSRGDVITSRQQVLCLDAGSPITALICSVRLTSKLEACPVCLCGLFCRLSYCANTGPRELTFTWWKCYGLCLWHKLSFFFCFSVYFCLYGPFNCISHKFSRPLSVFSLCSSGLIFLSYSSFQLYIFLHKSLLQPWYNPKWLTGLKTPINQLTNC